MVVVVIVLVAAVPIAVVARVGGGSLSGVVSYVVVECNGGV